MSQVFQREEVGLVLDEAGALVEIVTKIDLVDYLTRRNLEP